MSCKTSSPLEKRRRAQPSRGAFVSSHELILDTPPGETGYQKTKLSQFSENFREFKWRDEQLESSDMAWKYFLKTSIDVKVNNGNLRLHYDRDAKSYGSTNDTVEDILHEKGYDAHKQNDETKHAIHGGLNGCVLLEQSLGFWFYYVIDRGAYRDEIKYKEEHNKLIDSLGGAFIETTTRSFHNNFVTRIFAPDREMLMMARLLLTGIT